MTATPTTDQKPTGTTYLREGMTTFLAIVLLAVTMYMLADTYLVARASLAGRTDADARLALEAYARQKDVLTIAVGFLGAVIGYYFGRVPAEKRADTAEKQADQAKANELATRTEVATTVPAALELIRSAKVAVGGAGVLGGGAAPPAGGAAPPPAAVATASELDDAERQLERLLNRVR